MMAISGSNGSWFYVGKNVGGGFSRRGKRFTMIANWVTCEAKGVPMHIYISRKIDGYFAFHLLGNGRSVYFRRKLHKDSQVGHDLPANFEINHIDFDVRNNMSTNMEFKSRDEHHAITAKHKMQKKRNKCRW